MGLAPVVRGRGPVFGAAARAEKEFAGRPLLSEKELYGAHLAAVAADPLVV